MITLHLVAVDLDLIASWQVAFKPFPEVNIIEADILSVAENTIVSPANNYGYMDGGLDRLLTDFFGLQPQQEVQTAIAKRPEGYLPVGAAILVNTGHKRIPYMISAPTMLLPEPIPAANVFFAMSAMLQIAHVNHDVVKNVYCPGLGTGVGMVSPDVAAIEMANAYKKLKQRWDTNQKNK